MQQDARDQRCINLGGAGACSPLFVSMTSMARMHLDLLIPKRFDLQLVTSNSRGH